MARFVLSFVVTMAFGLALAGEASADGACVYLKNEAFQCTQASSSLACHKRAPSGEFHEDTTCARIGHGVTWGLASPPPPPAKGSFEGASLSRESRMDVPAIPSPFKKRL
jgi:hypothetical protein